MATQNFNDAIKTAEDMTVIAPDGRKYTGKYTDPKIDRTTLPAGWYCYDIRHDDDGCGIFCQLCHNIVIVNNAGSFVTQTPIPELNAEGSFVDFFIDEEEWNQLHEDDSECPANHDSDWEYTF